MPLSHPALKKIHARFVIDLNPVEASHALVGVKEELNSLLLRFDDDLGGVVLSYSNEKILSYQAEIHGYFPLVRVQVEADVVVFSPEEGHTLAGRINAMGTDYISVLVLGLFNAIVNQDSIRGEFKPELGGQSYVSLENPDHRVELNTDVTFRVIGLESSADFFSIQGSLMDADTGATAFLPSQKTTGNGGRVDKRQKKKHRNEKKLKSK